MGSRYFDRVSGWGPVKASAMPALACHSGDPGPRHARPGKPHRTTLFRAALGLAGFLAAAAPLDATPRDLIATGASLLPGYESALRRVSGPDRDIPGFTADQPAMLEARLDQPVSNRGSLAFWFHTDCRYQSGTATEETEQTLLELPGVLSVTFVTEQASINLYIGWGDRRDTVTRGAAGTRKGIQFDRLIRVLLPEWPGPDWHHVAINWDAGTGDSNAFVNGTPYHIRGARIAPWANPPADRLRAAPGGRFALADLRVSAQPLSESTLRALVGAKRWGSLDRLLGVAGYGQLDPTPHRGAEIYFRRLARAEDVADWVLEGPGNVHFRDGWMELSSQRPDGPNGHVVFWPRAELPDRILVEFEFEVLSEHGLNILFFGARGHGDRDIFDPAIKVRDGTFIDYTHGDIDSYHISYFANAPAEPRAVANLRKNSGFFLLANGPVALAKGGTGRSHRATLLKDGAHLRMAVDGEVLIDFTDDGLRAGPVWGAGKLGFRQMQWSSCRYRNLRVSALR